VGTVRVTSWQGAQPANEASVRQQMQSEGLNFYAWGNGPGDRYAAHTHPYDKVIFVARGSITFELPAAGRSLLLRTGDRLDLPATTLHSALVGDDGVLCCEAHLPAGTLA